jgi:hypothetical protein
MKTARSEALQAILLIESIIETIGWKINYTAFKIVVKNTIIRTKKRN